MKKNGLILFALFIPGLLFLNFIGVFNRVSIVEKQMGPYFLHCFKGKVAAKQAGEAIAVVRKKTASTEMGFFIAADSLAGVLSKPGAVSDSMFTQHEFQKQRCAVIAYPNTNFLSVHSGATKARRKLESYLKEHHYQPAPIMELYEKDKILYVVSIRK